MSDEPPSLVEDPNLQPDQNPVRSRSGNIGTSPGSGAVPVNGNGTGQRESSRFKPRFTDETPGERLPLAPRHQTSAGRPMRNWSSNMAESLQRDDVKKSPRYPSNQIPSTEGDRPLRLFPGGMDSLREYPPLDFRDSNELLGHRGAASDILLTHSVEESDREVLYEHDLLRMFRQRLRLNAFLGLLLIPLFYLFYYHLSPVLARQTMFMHFMLAIVCGVYLVLPSRIQSLMLARLLSVFGYTLVSMGASLVMLTLSQNHFEANALTGIQLAMLAAHSQILLSVVLLPLTLWESLVMAIIVTISLAWASWWPVQGDAGSVMQSQLFVLLTTAVFVLCVAHFQSVLRRRAFDATFDLARSAAQLQTLSTLDAVTGGFNRLYLEHTLSLEINRASRFERSLSVLMFDLDNFKIVNDTQGHTTGDEVLRLVNDAACRAMRDVDTCARYGGDEFMAVLPETEHEDALAIAERVQEEVHQQLIDHYGARTLAGSVTISAGLTTVHPRDQRSVEEVVSLADERLYDAKRMGKNRIAF